VPEHSASGPGATIVVPDVDGRRAAVRAAVAAHPPGDAREAAARRQVLELLDRLAHPFDRSAGPVHVTGSAVVTGELGTVLLRHKRLGRWMQPGGHVDAGEHPAEAAVREVTEETGLEVRHPGSVPTLVHVDVHPAAAGHVHLDLRFWLEAETVRLAPGPGESRAVAWFGWDEAIGLADPSLRGALVTTRRHLEARHREADGCGG